ncbi:MAG: Cof-type HAD-IIB family hydrolase [Clostridiales bacterium]|nr:Cof-type HAD-IIB family hydrolase [Clostridiales bacterium]
MTDLSVLRERAKRIRLVATDLDRTLLDGKHCVPEENQKALEACAARGLVLCAATGRAFSALPEQVLRISGMRYLISSNGAKIHDNETGALLRESYLSPEAIRAIWPLLSDPDVLCEFFWDGSPYVQADRYERHEAIPDWFLDYFLESRNPVPDIAEAVDAHIHKIENVNFVFGTDEVRERIRAFLSAHGDLFEQCSSMPFNFEIGGKGVTKAAALDFLCAREGMEPADCLCFGDSENDAKMIAWAGIGVAVENAVPEAKAVADLITLDNEHSGVADALRALALISEEYPT